MHNSQEMDLNFEYYSWLITTGSY